jgi:hypothetical protein
MTIYFFEKIESLFDENLKNSVNFSRYSLIVMLIHYVFLRAKM